MREVLQAEDFRLVHDQHFDRREEVIVAFRIALGSCSVATANEWQYATHPLDKSARTDDEAQAQGRANDQVRGVEIREKLDGLRQ